MVSQLKIESETADVPAVNIAAKVARHEDAIRVLQHDERFAKDVRDDRDPRHLGQMWLRPVIRPLAHTILDGDGTEILDVSERGRLRFRGWFSSLGELSASQRRLRADPQLIDPPVEERSLVSLPVGLEG